MFMTHFFDHPVTREKSLIIFCLDKTANHTVPTGPSFNTPTGRISVQVTRE